MDNNSGSFCITTVSNAAVAGAAIVVLLVIIVIFIVNISINIMLLIITVIITVYAERMYDMLREYAYCICRIGVTQLALPDWSNNRRFCFSPFVLIFFDVSYA